MPPCQSALCHFRLASLAFRPRCLPKSTFTPILILAAFRPPPSAPGRLSLLYLQSISVIIPPGGFISEPVRLQSTEHHFRSRRSFGFPAVLRFIRVPSASEECFRHSHQSQTCSEKHLCSQRDRSGTQTLLSLHSGLFDVKSVPQLLRCVESTGQLHVENHNY